MDENRYNKAKVARLEEEVEAVDYYWVRTEMILKGTISDFIKKKGLNPIL